MLPRTPEQREELQRAGGFIVPERAIDAQSLIAYADLVVSAGGTMNREAVALGTPVFTVVRGALGCRRRGAARRRPAATPGATPIDVELVKRPAAVAAERIRRDPAILADLLLRAAVPERLVKPGRQPEKRPQRH